MYYHEIGLLENVSILRQDTVYYRITVSFQTELSTCVPT
jgi:hypothetical protein